MHHLFMRLLSLIMVVCVGVGTVFAQADPDTTDCSTVGVNRQIDIWYNDYLGARGEFDTTQALDAAAALNAQVADLLASCGFVAEMSDDSNAEQTGIGTRDDPFVVRAPGVVGSTTITITGEVRPAADLLSEAGVNNVQNIPDDQEYIVVFLEISCQQGAANTCEIGDDAFRLTSDQGNIYEPTLDQYELYLPRSVSLGGGLNRTGAIPFLINADEMNVVLIYYPNEDPLNPQAEVAYFVAQGTADTVEVQSTTPELIIRNRPVAGSAPVGVFRRGQSAVALGRTEDGAWIYVEAPEGSGWVSAEFVESEVDLGSLRTVAEDAFEETGTEDSDTDQ